MRPFVFSLVAAGLFSTGCAGIAVSAPLLPHRAVYDLKLDSASERSGITEMSGRMVYEFTGNECEGYRVNFRFVTRLNSGGEVKVTDQQTTTYEDLKNRNFDFETRTYSGPTLDKTINGTASRSDQGVTVELLSPDEKQLSLGEGRFPTEHMKAIIEQADKGAVFFESALFDGSDTADKLMQTTTVVGAKVVPAGTEGDAANAGQLKQAPVWPVTIAYFNDVEGADAQPIYRISFKLYDNGVTRDLTMDYGDFVLKGNLASLEMLKADPCGQN